MEEQLNYTSLEQFRETDSINNSTSTSDQNNSTNGTDDTGLIDETARTVALVSFPFIILFGTIGNVLTFVVMRKGSLKRSSSCFYRAILALADTGMLWAGALMQWTYYFSHADVNFYALTGCKIIFFVYFFCLKYPSTILVILSVEKFIALYFPLKAKRVCNLGTAKRVVIVTAILFAGLDCQFFFIVTLQTDTSGTKICNYVNVSPDYIRVLIGLITPILHSFAPFLIMTTANLAIIYKFMIAKCKDEITCHALSRSAVRGTTMLLTVSFAFIILTGPVSFILFLELNIPPFASIIAVALEFINHAINSVLYCISGSRFRNELKKTVFWWRKYPGIEYDTRRSSALNMSQMSPGENYM